MTVKLGALIVKGEIPRPRRKQRGDDYIRTLRLFEGLGKPLSSWEVEQLVIADEEKE